MPLPIDVDEERAMWVLWVREAEPDAPYWPGRRRLAAIDAVVWPLLWVAGMMWVSPRAGVFAPVVIMLAFLSLCSRLHRALLRSERYRFTTWRWGRFVVLLWVVGVVFRLTLPV